MQSKHRRPCILFSYFQTQATVAHLFMLMQDPPPPHSVSLSFIMTQETISFSSSWKHSHFHIFWRRQPSLSYFLTQETVSLSYFRTQATVSLLYFLDQATVSLLYFLTQATVSLSYFLTQATVSPELEVPNRGRRSHLPRYTEKVSPLSLFLIKWIVSRAVRYELQYIVLQVIL